MKVVLRKCNSDAGSQQWSMADDGYFHNRNSPHMCLEGDDRGIDNNSAYVYECGQGDHQKWEDIGNGKYKNVGHGYYLGTKDCRIQENTVLAITLIETYGDCNCAQKWNQSQDCTISVRSYCDNISA